MEEHPDRQPRRAETMDGGNHDDGDCDQEFESERIYKRPLQAFNSAYLCVLCVKLPEIRRERREVSISLGLFYGIASINPCACAARNIDEV